MLILLILLLAAGTRANPEPHNHRAGTYRSQISDAGTVQPLNSRVTQTTREV